MTDIGIALTVLTQKVTRQFARQKRAEIRDARAASRRNMASEPKVVAKEKLFDGILVDAYAKASDNGRLPAAQRQIYYAARDLYLKVVGGPMVAWKTFCDYLAEYVDTHKPDWRITKDARGNFIEPHTRRKVPLGTIDTDSYIARSQRPSTAIDDVTLETRFPTMGPVNRYSAIIYIEKEGFNPILEEAEILTRYDVAIASSKGQSVVAMRRMVDEFCGRAGIPLLVVHDFDKSGFEIADQLTKNSVRYEFQNDIDVVDLGLRLADVEKYGLSSEPCKIKGTLIPGATPEEREFLLSGRRVELNHMTSSQFVDWIESKLVAQGIRKVIPDDATLARAFRRAASLHRFQSTIDAAAESSRVEAESMELPQDLHAEVGAAFKRDPTRPWDDVIAEIAKREITR